MILCTRTWALWGCGVVAIACESLGHGASRGPTPTVTIATSRGDVVVQVEIANTFATRESGLMFRRELGPSQGMIFIFPSQAVHTFWMKNTYLPLDMIFINSARIVIGVVANAEPLTLTSRSVNASSLFVLEVNAGFAARHQIQAGAAVTFSDIPLVTAE